MRCSRAHKTLKRSQDRLTRGNSDSGAVMSTRGAVRLKVHMSTSGERELRSFLEEGALNQTLRERHIVHGERQEEMSQPQKAAIKKYFPQ